MANYSGLTSKAVSGMFFQAFEESAAAAFAPKVCSPNLNSTQATEIYKSPIITKGLSKLEGSLKMDPAPLASYTLNNEQWADALEIDINDWKFDNTGTVQRLIGEKAAMAAMHNDTLISALMDNGTSANDQFGVPFFGSHTVGGTTQTNIVQYDAVSTTNPTASEISVLVSNMLATAYGFKNGAGYKVNGIARAWMLLYPAGWINTEAAIGNSLLPNGASVQENPLVAYQEGRYNLAKTTIIPFVNPYLTGTDSCYLCRLDGRSTRPFVLQVRDPLAIQELTEGSTDAVYRHRYVFALKENKNVGYNDFTQCVKGQMT